MTTPLLTLALHRPRDLLLARCRARQIARLLGFEPREQAGLAAAVFDRAHAVLTQGRGLIEFQLDGDALHVFAVRGSRRIPVPPRLEMPLPNRLVDLDRTDLAWVVQELGRLTRWKVFDEIRQQNQELLHLYHELQMSRKRPGERPTAA